MPILKWNSKPAAAASAKNVEYISRDSACDSLSFYNMDEHETGDKQQNKTNAIAYAEERMEQEADKRGDRNHYRFVLTFDRDVDTQEAKEEAYKYLEKEFPNSKAIVAVHQEKNKSPDKADEKFSHVHVWMDCRDKETGRKLQIDNKKFKSMDERWTRQYDQKYGTEYEKQFKEQKRETAEWKKQYKHAKENGLELPKKPERVADTYFKDKKERYIEKDYEAAGIKYEKSGTGRNSAEIANEERSAGDGKPELPNSEQPIAYSEQAINRASSAADRANSAVDAAVRGTEELSNSIDKLAERNLPDRDITPKRTRDSSRDSYDR